MLGREKHPIRKRYRRRITVYAASVSSVILLFILGQLWQLNHLHDSWRQFSSEAHARSQVLADLNRAVGYGGLIHNFKNFLLRREMNLLPRLEQDAQDLNSALGRYRQLPLGQEEVQALDQVEQVFAAYMRHVDLIYSTELRMSQLLLLDQQVRIDDTPALSALRRLKEQNGYFIRQHQRQLDREIRNCLIQLLSGLFLMPVVLWAAWRYNGLFSHLLQARQENSQVRRELNASNRQGEALKQIAYQCPLTRIANRAAFVSHFEEAVADAREEQSHIALLFVDLDDFKQINDRFGHEMGDRVLIAVAERLSLVLREGDMVARMGGDEFALLALGVESRDQFNGLAMRLYQALDEPFAMLPEDVEVNCSIGGALYPEQGEDLQLLLNVADENMYRIKRNGKNGLMISV